MKKMKMWLLFLVMAWSAAEVSATAYAPLRVDDLSAASKSQYDHGFVKRSHPVYGSHDMRLIWIAKDGVVASNQLRVSNVRRAGKMVDRSCAACERKRGVSHTKPCPPHGKGPRHPYVKPGQKHPCSCDCHRKQDHKKPHVEHPRPHKRPSAPPHSGRR